MKKNSQDKYFALAKKIDFTQEGSRQNKLLDLLNEMEKNANEGYRYFFQGEKAFLSENYKEALKFYLRAKEVDNIAFYCHRCHAFLYAQKQRYKESLQSLKKAMLYFHDDQSSLSLFNNLKNQLTPSTSSTYPSIPLESLKHSDFLQNFQPPNDDFTLQQPQDLFLSEGEVQAFDQSFSLFNRLSSKEDIQWEDDFSQTGFLEENELWEEDYKEMFSWEDIPLSSQKEEKVQAPWTSFPWEKQEDEQAPLNELFTSEETLLKHYAHSSNTTFHNQMMFCSLNSYTSSTREKEKQLAQVLNPFSSHEGFFLNWEGCGVACNPSFNFLQNLAEAKLNLLDINYLFFDSQRPLMVEYVEKLSTLHRSLQVYKPQSSPLKLYPLNASLNKGDSGNSKDTLSKPSISIEAIELSPCLKVYLPSPSAESFLGMRIQFFKENKEKHLHWAWINMQQQPLNQETFFEGCDLFLYDFSLMKEAKHNSEESFIEQMRAWMLAQPQAYHLVYGHHSLLPFYPFRTLKQLRKENNNRLLPLIADARLDIHSLKLMCHYSKQFFSWEDTLLLSQPFPDKNAVFLGKPLFI